MNSIVNGGYTVSIRSQSSMKTAAGDDIRSVSRRLIDDVADRTLRILGPPLRSRWIDC